MMRTIDIFILVCCVVLLAAVWWGKTRPPQICYNIVDQTCEPCK